MSETKLPGFHKAEKKKAWLKLALCGPSGSGKTYSALTLAKGLKRNIAFIDTENSSASLYADKFEFDTLEIDPPYTIEKYAQAIKVACCNDKNYGVLIIDSLTHAWAGEGGLLAKKEAMDSMGGNSFTNWGKISKEHELLKARILAADIHIIATMRSKQDYVLQTNDKGKQVPIKVGLAPIQRDGMEYEFTTVFDIAMNHFAQVSKDRTGLFDGQLFQITEETGNLYLDWLNAAAGVLAKPSLSISVDQRNRLWAIAKEKGWTEDTLKPWLKAQYGIESTKLVPHLKYNEIVENIQKGPQ